MNMPQHGIILALLGREPEVEEEECVFCGERRGPDQFEDGLRCRFCAEEQDEEAPDGE
jgi:hypothetical protein